MPRKELFELHDHPLFPAFLRDLVTDALQVIWDFSNSYKPILPVLRTAMAAAGTTEVVDLCSGGGGPWTQLVQGIPITVCLTDKYPNQRAFDRAHSSSGGRIGSDSRSIEATNVPADLRGFRTMFSSFHHFNESEARQVLASAMEHRYGIAIFETVRREARILLAISFIPFLILFLTPRIRPFRWSRVLWTYIIPVVPFVLWFDGFMSCMRGYSDQELSELTQGLPAVGYRWELGTQRDGFLPVTYLIGYPVDPEGDSTRGHD
jgi:hypothetical protein